MTSNNVAMSKFSLIKYLSNPLNKNIYAENCNTDVDRFCGNVIRDKISYLV